MNQSTIEHIMKRMDETMATRPADAWQDMLISLTYMNVRVNGTEAIFVSHDPKLPLPLLTVRFTYRGDFTAYFPRLSTDAVIARAQSVGFLNDLTTRLNEHTSGRKEA